MSRFIFSIAVLILMFSACVENVESPYDVPEGAAVYVPVYLPEESALQISTGPSMPIENPGKIFLYQDFLMVNIPGQGFHVIDNANPAAPQPLFFINVPGSRDVAIKDGYIYADNYADIVVFTIDENREVQVIKRLKDIMNNQLYPPFRDVYFECVDPSKGIVVDWVISDNKQVSCYRP
jgi:hypothetical protein